MDFSNIKNNKIINYLMVILGCFIIAFAITSILVPNGLATGGPPGIAIVLEKVTGINYTLTNYIISLIVLIIAGLTIGKKEIVKILLVSITLPALIIVFENLNLVFIQDDMFLASIFYGIIAGFGCGLILKNGFTLGGTDTLAKILHLKVFPFVSISQLLLVIDVIVISASAFILDYHVALYAIIAQFIIVKTIDAVMFGFGSKSVKLEIISVKHESIINYIISDLNRGVSSINITSGFTKDKKKKLISICSPRDAVQIKRYIATKDPEAFMYMLPVNSAWGGEFDSFIEEE